MTISVTPTPSVTPSKTPSPSSTPTPSSTPSPSPSPRYNLPPSFAADLSALSFAPQLPPPSWGRRYVPTSGALFGATQGYPAVLSLISIVDNDSPAAAVKPADLVIGSPIEVRLSKIEPQTAATSWWPRCSTFR